MTKDEVNELNNGVYRIHWENGGSSVASVGRLYDGSVWMLPSNWTGNGRISATVSYWPYVKKVELITSS